MGNKWNGVELLKMLKDCDFPIGIFPYFKREYGNAYNSYNPDNLA